MTTAEDYLAATDETGAVAAAVLMDRLTERLKAADGSAAQLKERRAAAEAVAEIAQEAERPETVVNEALNNAGGAAQRSNTKKDQITDAIRSATEEIRLERSKADIGLDEGYALDKYLETNLVRVKKYESTDHHADPRYLWEFDDNTAVETTSGLPYEWYEFWKKLTAATDKQLLPEFASEEIGDPDDDPQYAALSLGPESRPWAKDNYIQCISDLEGDRVTHVETVGPRTEVWEAVRNHIARSRAVTDLSAAIEHKAVHVTHTDEGDLAEVWVPTAIINREADEHGVEPHALHSEVVARGADSDELGGEKIAEAKRAGTTTARFWRLDATHDEVPEPDEVVDELTTSTDSLDSVEWGETDE